VELGLGVLFRTLLLTGVLIVATSQAVEARAVPVPVPARVGPCSKTIDVNLTAQQLVASECARVFAATPITSGRPGLSTPTGAFAIVLKEQDVTFFSPWPQGDPNYYPPMPVAYAMEFLDGGYFLHTDADEPPSAFGPGSEDGPYASHGCVHVPTAVMERLYAWAADGTAVSIHY
jgi:lipoprotein-anchoring transpeptidase ErfK/SrfK